MHRLFPVGSTKKIGGKAARQGDFLRNPSENPTKDGLLQCKAARTDIFRTGRRSFTTFLVVNAYFEDSASANRADTCFICVLMAICCGHTCSQRRQARH